MSGCSLIEMSSDKVREMAESCLGRIQAWKDERKAGAIAEERASYARSWWRRLFGLGIPTDEEIWAELGYGFGGVHFEIHMYAWGSKDAAEKLLKAAQYADTVLVSASDLDMVA